MQQSIRYKGLSLTPDEMAVENGALSLCGNVELHDGALRPSIVTGTPLSEPLTLGEGGVVVKLAYIHETGNYRHFIGTNQWSIYWFNEDGSLGSSTPIKSFIGVTSITSVGNTLIIIDNGGSIHYALWKDGGYQYLGLKPPFMNLSFEVDTEDTTEDYELGGINGASCKEGVYEAVQQTTYTCDELFTKVSDTNWNRGDICINVKEDKQGDFTESIYALLNRTNNLIARHGRFYANFFVRYCYQMFDGSMIMHSAPVFMPVQVPDSYEVWLATLQDLNSGMNVPGSSYFITGKEINWDLSGLDLAVARYGKDGQLYKTEKVTKAAFVYLPRNVSLKYKLSGDVTELRKWGDIIKSIDIFITPPITNIDTSEKLTSLCISTENYCLGRGKIQDQTFYHTSYVSVNFPKLANDVYKNKLDNASAYYRICSLNVSDIFVSSMAFPVPIDKSVVYQLSLQTQMKDDYKTHNLLYAKGGYVYNHRLNLYGVQEILFSGFSPTVMFPGILKLQMTDRVNPYYKIKKVVVQLATTSGTKYVETASSITIEGYLLRNSAKFYPDARAEKMVFFLTETSSDIDYIFVFDLTPCKELNGAIHMGDFDSATSLSKVSSFDYTLDNMVEMGNKIYTSESDNAFYFPLNGINTVGLGTIQGIASTTRALSQGQFGQYPLMAFSTDGIWALDVSAQGTYSNIHPISREVCSNTKSITQLDQSVLFITSRSVNRVAESQVATISDVLDGPYFDVGTHMKQFYDFFDTESSSMFSKVVGLNMRELINFSDHPIDFFQKCLPIYDYINSRVLFLNIRSTRTSASSHDVVFAYSTRDNSWSTVIMNYVLTAINSYPHPYIQYSDGSVVCLDKGHSYDEDDTIYHGIIVTRTLKFDEDECPDAITGYVHSLTTDAVPVMWIYGSNDNQNWHYLGRCGRMRTHCMSCKSYRYFRLAIYLRMKSKAQYFATRLDIIRRFSKF